MVSPEDQDQDQSQPRPKNNKNNNNNNNSDDDDDQSHPENDKSKDPYTANMSPFSRIMRSKRAEYVRPRSIRVKVGSWNVAAHSGAERDVGDWFVRGKGVVGRLSSARVLDGEGDKDGEGDGDGERGEQGQRQEQGRRDDESGGGDNDQKEGGRAEEGRGGSKGEKHDEDGTTVPFPRDGDNDGNAKPGPHGSNPEDFGLYVLGLQEVVDINSAAEALRPYYDPGPANRWKNAVQKALPPGYKLVADSQLVGLLLLIYASPSVAGNISSVSSKVVATGLLGYMGNKGAVVTRIVLGQTTPLVFINCHLAAGSDKSSLDRRNWDAAQVLSRTRFDPVDMEHELVDDPAETIGKECFAFWLGDLNYRLEDVPSDDVRNVLHRHTLNSYDGTSGPQDEGKQERRKYGPSRSGDDDDDEDNNTDFRQATVRGGQEQDSSGDGDGKEDDQSDIPGSISDDTVDPLTDPNSLQTTIASLFPHDQLSLQQKQKKAFHDGWREGPISFLPTYKYDVGSVAVFDSSEKHRGPSWCDRILYRSRRDLLEYEKREREILESRKKDEEMKKRGLDKSAEDDDVLFEYNPSTDGADNEDDDDQYDSNKDQSDNNLFSDSEETPNDPIHLEYYDSCQGVLTSDHKPLEAVFTLDYEPVVTELKAKVHQEVVRELDKAENESRPDLTVVLDDPKANKNSAAGKDVNLIDFGDVTYFVPVSQYLVAANTSGVPATFCFAETPSFVKGPFRAVPSWLEIHIELRVDVEDGRKRDTHPGEHTLFPGELATIQVTACVSDMNHVRVLNYGQIKLEEILVLRVKGGRDHFIPVHGNWLPTCFGRSVDDLTHMPEAGARTLEPSPEAWARQKGGAGARLSAPRELFRLTETISELTERAVAEWSMTKGEESPPPWLSEPHGTLWPFLRETWIVQEPSQRAPLLAAAREALDTNKALHDVFPPEVPSLHRLEILSETLLTFLQSLSDGIVTASVWQKLDQDIIAREKAKTPSRTWEQTQAWVLENLAYSPAHSVSFTFVTFMLAHIANEVAPVFNITPKQPQQQQPPPSTPSTSSSNKNKRHSSSRDQPTTPNNDNNNNSQDENSAPPTPLSTAAFISAGSFRRRARSRTSSSTATTASSSSEPPTSRLSISNPNSNSNSSSSSSSNPATSALLRRQTVEAALATFFSYYLISGDVKPPAKDKERRAWEGRKRGVIEPFLKTLGVDSLGPSGGGK